MNVEVLCRPVLCCSRRVVLLNRVFVLAMWWVVTSRSEPLASVGAVFGVVELLVAGAWALLKCKHELLFKVYLT